MKTLDIKGKKYVPVNERIKYFRKNFETYAVVTEIIRCTDEDCIIKATVYDEESRVRAVGHAQEFRNGSNINKTSYVENCETSAVGRALGFLGIGIDESVASADELNLALEHQNQIQRKLTKNELGALKMKCEAKGRDFSALLSYYDAADEGALNYGQWMDAMRILDK